MWDKERGHAREEHRWGSDQGQGGMVPIFLFKTLILSLYSGSETHDDLTRVFPALPVIRIKDVEGEHRGGQGWGAVDRAEGSASEQDIRLNLGWGGALGG